MLVAQMVLEIVSTWRKVIPAVYFLLESLQLGLPAPLRSCVVE